MAGFVKIYRKILDNPIICKDSDHLSTWLFLLLSAAHESHDVLFGKDKITLKIGQLITSRKSISDKLGINESKVERILTSFKNEHQIEQQSSSKSRLITILKWGDYQKREQQNEHHLNNIRTASEQQVNTNKNDKNEKNEKNKDLILKDVCRFTPPTHDEVSQFITENKYMVDADRFISFYESKGWMVGKNKMKDWKASVRGWHTRHDQSSQGRNRRVEIVPDYSNEVVPELSEEERIQIIESFKGLKNEHRRSCEKIENSGRQTQSNNGNRHKQ